MRFETSVVDHSAFFVKNQEDLFSLKDEPELNVFSRLCPDY